MARGPHPSNRIPRRNSQRSGTSARERPDGSLGKARKATKRSVLRQSKRAELALHRYLFGNRLKTRPPGFHGYDIGGSRFGWIGEVKDGYKSRRTETVLSEALEQCRRHALEKGLQGVGIFAVLHRRGQRYRDSLVMFETPNGETGMMTAAEFRAYLEGQGLLRDD